MASSLQFHCVHGEHIKLSRNNTIAKRVDSFCKGICFSNRTIQIREKVYVRLLNKSIQWTGFLRLGVTTADPSSHRSSTSLPRHACPDLTCRPGSNCINIYLSIFLFKGYWAKCVPENCFDVTNKLTYFYVDANGELFLNTPTGEISLLTGKFQSLKHNRFLICSFFIGISVHEPLWALLDIYGNCISIELVCDPQQRTQTQNDQIRQINPVLNTHFYDELRNELIPLPFLPVHNSLISFFQSSSSSSNSSSNSSIVLYDNSKNTDGLVFFSDALTINSGLLIHILNVQPSNESRLRTTATSASSNSLSTQIQFGLTNCDIKDLIRRNDLPLDIEQINRRSEFWVIENFQLGNKTSIDRDDEFLFTFNQNGVIQYSHNDSKLQDFLHVDSNLIYYPFLIFKGDIVAVRSMGLIKNLDKYRFCQSTKVKLESNQTNHELNMKTKTECQTETEIKLNQDCTVCFDRIRDTVLIPCGHICLCYSCAKGLVDHGTKQCMSFFLQTIQSFKLYFLGPICRSSITLYNRIYLA